MKVENSIHHEWVQWQQQEHIPDIMATGQFIEYKFYRLLEQDESDGITYVIQYIAANHNHYHKYINEFAPLLREKAFKRWANRFITFRTIMEPVQ